MRIALLGPLEVLNDAGSPVTLTAGRQRAVLAALALRANRVVSVEALAELLWGEDQPPTARASVFNYVARLRRSLGHQSAARLRTVGGGYLLQIDGNKSDHLEAAALDSLALNAAVTGDWPAVSSHTATALALWRGEPLQDVSGERLSAEYVPALEELHLRLQSLSLDAHLFAARYDVAVPALDELIRSHPLREPLYERLLLARYGSGHRADALAVFRQARSRFREDLGIEPSRTLRELHELALHDAPVADLESLLRAHRYPQEHTESPTPRNAAKPAVPHRRLPTRPPLLTGRDAEIKELTRQAFGPDGEIRGGATVLSGTAGVGKTALALAWAHQTAARFPDGRVYLDLNGFAADESPLTTDEACCILLDCLGVSGDRQPATPDGRIALYRAAVADKRLLLILDNALDGRQVSSLIPTAGSCRVLVTSRHTLMSLVVHEGADAVGLAPLAAEDARELLTRRLGTERAAGQDATIALVAERCARLPLALTIVAARAASLAGVPLDRIAAQLVAEHGGLALLDGGDPTTSVRTVISWSYRQLAPGPARLFRLLGLHPGPDISLPAASALAGAAHHDTASDLAELRAMSLAAELVPGRYSTHALLRAFARERLRAEDGEADRAAAHHRLVDFYLASSVEANSRIAGHPELWARISPDRDPGVEPERFAGFDAATAWFAAESDALRNITADADAAGADDEMWRLAYAQITHLDRHGRWREALELASLGMAAATRLDDTAAQAHLNLHIGGYLAKLGDVPAGRDRLLAAWEHFEKTGDAAGAAHAQQNLSNVYSLQGDWAEAADRMRSFLAFSRSTGHQLGVSVALNALGWFLAHLDDLDGALAHCLEAATLVHTLGRSDIEAHVRDSLGFIHRRLGDHAAAAADYRKAAELFNDVDNAFHAALELLRLGDVHTDVGDTEAARTAWSQALVLFEKVERPEAEEMRRRLAACPDAGHGHRK